MRSGSFILVFVLFAGGCGGKTAGRVVADKCGNGVVDTGEECDGTNLGGAVCEGGGAVACTSACTLDATGCTGVVVKCGDGTRAGAEQCDGIDLGGESCDSLGLVGGDLHCTPSCVFDASACTGTSSCPDGTRQYPEACDTGDLADEDCDSLGFFGGTLACLGDCTFDTSGCVSDTTPTCTPTPTAAQVDEGGGPLAIAFVCTDQDGDALSVTATDAMAAPGGGVTFADDGPGATLGVTITLDPDTDDAGATGTASFDVSFTVADPASHAVTVVQAVTFDNLAPTFSPNPIPDVVVTTGTSATLEITFTDADGDALAFGSSLPAYANLATSGNVATVTFTPTGPGDDSGSPDAGSVTGDDNQGGVVSAAFNAIVNQPPVADAGADVSGAPGDPIVLDGAGSSDPDDDSFTYAWSPVGTAPALDDTTSATPTLVGGVCNETYTYQLVVNDGRAVSAPDTVAVTVTTVGPYVSKDGCTPGDECGDLTKPWCTIQAGIDAARVNAFPEVYVEAGVYPEDPVVTSAASGDPAILGGYTDLATLTRAASPSCDTTTASGATVIETSTSVGVEFDTGTTNLFERFCVKANVVGGDLAHKANLTIRDASPTIRGNIIDAVAAGAVTDTVGIEIINTTSTAPLIEQNMDEPTGGLYFGGDGTASSTGIAIAGPVDLVLDQNRIDGGTGTDDSAGVVHVGSGSIVATQNVIAGGSGADSSRGVVIYGDSGSYDVTLLRNTIAGGASTTEATGVDAYQVDHLRVEDTNQIRGSTASTRDAVGIKLNAVDDLRIVADNSVIGGRAQRWAYGVQLIGGTSAALTTRNVIRGGSAVSGASAATTRLVGVSAASTASLQVDTENVISGADVDPSSGSLVHGGLIAMGIEGQGVPDVQILSNDAILGGSPELPVVSPGGASYLGAGIVLRNSTRFDVSTNTLIQGCSPSCGPGNSPIVGMPTGVGVWIDQRAAAGFKTLANNALIRGGPTTGGPSNFNNTLGVGIAVTGPRSGTGPNVSILGNGTIAGNDAPASGLASLRTFEAVGILVTNAQATIESNVMVVGGRGYAAAVGVRVKQDLDTPTSAVLSDNVSVSGNPYSDDHASDPLQVRGVEFTQVGSGTSFFAATGESNLYQEIAGGFARGSSQGRAIGVDLAGLDQALLRYNHVWGGLVPGALEQTGLKLVNIDSECVVDSNLIEACGVVGAGSAAHDAGCEPMYTRSYGVDVLDGVGGPTYLFNNLVFGGFSDQGSSGVRVVDSGVAAANLRAYHNYFNAQGKAGAGCIVATPDARAVDLGVGASGVGGGAGISFLNNIIDGGGRTCTRYGVYEAQATTDLFTALELGHNVFVQQNADRDLNPVGAVTWAYRESNGTNWCTAGVDPIPSCLNNPTAPTTATGYTNNAEGDPGFEGNDVLMSEMPGFLPLSDVHTKATVLQGTGRTTMVTLDYEGDDRDSSAPDIGHDETP